MKLSRGVWLMLLASLSFGLMNVSVKFVHDMPVSQVVFFRAVVQIVLSLGILFQLKQSPWGKNPKLLAMRGLFGSMGLFCYFYTLQVMPLGNAIVIHYLSPILTTLVAVALGDEKNHPLSYLFFGLCMIGVVVVNGVSNEVTMAGILAGLGGALFSAFAYNTIRRLKNLENPNVVVFYFPLITLPLSLMAYLLFDEAWRMPMGIEWFWLLMTGVTTQFGQFFMTRAYQSDKASNVSAISYAGIIWGAGFGVFLFDEKYQWLQYAGMALVLLGMFLNVRINLRREAAQ
ncbi:MAG: DMT family transporter [Bacteroidota bacterium]|jgi:drug/metabolite transporter (DMT)-like permease